MSVRKMTPVLLAERIEPVLSFWARLGVIPTVQVPDAGAPERLGFVILAGDGYEIMYQTVGSVRSDFVELAVDASSFKLATPQTILFVEVTSLADTEAAIDTNVLVIPRRTTFYGMNEIGYSDPAGNIIIFAEPAAGGA